MTSEASVDGIDVIGAPGVALADAAGIAVVEVLGSPGVALATTAGIAVVGVVGAASGSVLMYVANLLDRSSSSIISKSLSTSSA